MTNANYIQWLETMIVGCDDIGGMEREKAIYQNCLKKARNLGQTLPIQRVVPSTFIAENDNEEMIVIFAEDEEAAELKLRKQGIETYELRYMTKPNKHKEARLTKQVNLDEDFTEALNELFVSKTNTKKKLK